MKKTLFIISLVVLFIGCKKEETITPNSVDTNISSNSFNKTYNAEMSVGVLRDLQCNVSITGDGTRVITVITPSPQIDTMTIYGTYNSTLNTIAIRPCTDCFQGFNHKMFGIKSGGFSEFRDNKLYIKLDYYMAPDTVYISSFVLTEL